MVQPGPLPVRLGRLSAQSGRVGGSGRPVESARRPARVTDARWWRCGVVVPSCSRAGEGRRFAKAAGVGYCFRRCSQAHAERDNEREWRNRQTRTVQVRVPERAWGFNSPLAHRREIPFDRKVGRDFLMSGAVLPARAHSPTTSPTPPTRANSGSSRFWKWVCSTTTLRVLFTAPVTATASRTRWRSSLDFATTRTMTS